MLEIPPVVEFGEETSQVLRPYERVCMICCTMGIFLYPSLCQISSSEQLRYFADNVKLLEDSSLPRSSDASLTFLG